MRRIVLAPFVALTLMAVGGVPGATALSAGEEMRARIVAAAHEAGVDPALVLGHEITARMPWSSSTETTTLDDVFDAMSSTPVVGSGSGGEVLAGDVLHFFVDYSYDGPAGLASYDVSTSSVVPETPPVHPPPPVGSTAVDVGGPMRTISGGGWDFGGHLVGSAGFGSNVSTAPGSPEPFPFWVPVVTGGFVRDTSIDFMGHALVTQVSYCFFSFCVSFGQMYATGAATFNTEPVFPAIP